MQIFFAISLGYIPILRFIFGYQILSALGLKLSYLLFNKCRYAQKLFLSCTESTVIEQLMIFFPHLVLWSLQMPYRTFRNKRSALKTRIFLPAVSRYYGSFVFVSNETIYFNLNLHKVSLITKHYMIRTTQNKIMAPRTVRVRQLFFFILLCQRSQNPSISLHIFFFTFTDSVFTLTTTFSACEN